MKRAGLIAGLVGVALFTALIVWQGVDDVGRALASVGWGLVIVTLWHLLPIFVDALAWWLLFSRKRPGLGFVTVCRWLGESINQLLPVAQIGGDIAKARVLAGKTVTIRESGATVVVDTTIAAATQMVFGLLGGFILVMVVGRPELAWAIAAGLFVMLALIGVFYRLQRGGLFGALVRGAHRVSGKLVPDHWVSGAGDLDTSIGVIYQRRSVLIWAAVWRLIGWLLGAGEVWLALWFLGAPVGVADAIMLEAIGQAIRGTAFVVPGALGVQEGGFMALAPLVGLAPETGLALSLVKRVRELALGVPGLVAWQWIEGRSLARLLSTSFQSES